MLPALISDIKIYSNQIQLRRHMKNYTRNSISKVAFIEITNANAISFTSNSNCYYFHLFKAVPFQNFIKRLFVAHLIASPLQIA